VNNTRQIPYRRGALSKRTHLLTTWVLVVGFLLQPILAYLVTPLVTHDEQGQQIVMCTLQGEKLVTVDIPELARHDSTEHCSALKLYQMAGSTQVSQPPVVADVTLYAVEVLDQTAEHQHRYLHFSAYTTRAPPVA